MSNLTKASRELFKRQPDECFESLTALSEHCQRQKEACVDRWVPPRSIQTNPDDAGRLMMAAGDDGAFAMNDWSFGQLCRLAGVAKETVNRLTPDTAALKDQRDAFLESSAGRAGREEERLAHLSVAAQQGRPLRWTAFSMRGCTHTRPARFHVNIGDLLKMGYLGLALQALGVQALRLGVLVYVYGSWTRGRAAW